MNAVLQKIKHFHSFVIKPKKVWSMPTKSDFVIYDAYGSEIIKKYFFEKKISILFTRGEFINIPCLYFSLFKIKFWKGEFRKAYESVFIKAVKPRIVITCTDNNTNFYLLSKYSENTRTIFIQQGMRSYYRDVFEMLDKRANLDQNFEVDFMGVFGKTIGEKYEKYIKGKIIPIGCLRNNYYNIKTNTNIGTIGFISQYNKDIKGRMVNGNYFSYMDYWHKIDIEILSFLKLYCSNHQKELFIIPRFSDKNLLLEKEYFQSILDSNVLFFDKKSPESCYRAVDSAEVVIGIDDTLVYESAARGNKTAFFSIRRKSLNINQNPNYHDLDFGYPGNYADQGKFWTNNSDPSVYEKILNYLFSINKQEWQTELNRVGFSNIMNYDPNNTTLKSLIKVITH